MISHLPAKMGQRLTQSSKNSLSTSNCKIQGLPPNYWALKSTGIVPVANSPSPRARRFGALHIHAECHFGVLVYLWLYNAPSWVSSLGSSLVRLLYPAEDRKSTFSLISSAVPLFSKVHCLSAVLHSFIHPMPGLLHVALLLCPPAFTGHTFTKHQKKLSNGHYNLPLHQVVTSGIHLSCFFFSE